MQSISCAEAQQRLPEYLKRAFSGEEIRIEAGGKSGRLEPVADQPRERKTPREALASLQRAPELSADQAAARAVEIRGQRQAWKR